MLSAEPKAEADNTYREEENSENTRSQGTWIDIVIGNNALRAQPTD